MHTLYFTNAFTTTQKARTTGSVYNQFLKLHQCFNE
jgi:hypothetical protein